MLHRRAEQQCDDKTGGPFGMAQLAEPLVLGPGLQRDGEAAATLGIASGETISRKLTLQGWLTNRAVRPLIAAMVRTVVRMPRSRISANSTTRTVSAAPTL